MVTGYTWSESGRLGRGWLLRFSWWLGEWLCLVVGVEGHSYVKAPGFGPLAAVESRRALKLFSDLALIVLSVRFFRLGAIRLLKKFLRVGHWVDWAWSSFL